MKCPVCVEKGLKSCVYEGGTQTTLMCGQSYYDEDGNYHYNDPNTLTTSYSCSNGHRWSVSTCRGEEHIIIGKEDTLCPGR